MNVRGRLARLESLLGPEGGGLPGKTRSLKGLDVDAVLAAVEAAIDAADEDVLDRIDARCAGAEATPARDPRTGGPWFDEDGKQIFETHWFTYWLAGLALGSWSLPLRMPRVILEAFDAEYPVIAGRCENCRTALPAPLGKGTCPVCGAGKDMISGKAFYGPTHDQHFEYKPRNKVLSPGRSVPWPAHSYPENCVMPDGSVMNPMAEDAGDDEAAARE
jgi:hypothetical protein